jgi:nucleotide sugar dehydrogenase
LFVIVIVFLPADAGRKTTLIIYGPKKWGHAKGEKYFATGEYSFASGFSVAVITVPTPLRGGEPDLSFVQSAARELAPWVTSGCTVILESTTYPGTTDELLVPILEKGSGLTVGVDFWVGYSPERIDPGNPTWKIANTTKVVSGVGEESLRHVSDFYTSLGIPVFAVSGTREAEMSKLLENTFRHVNIAMVNELAKYSSQMGVNIWEAIEAASSKPFGFMKFIPGAGVGGHCLPIDPSYLSWAVNDSSGADLRFVALANEVNASMPMHVFRRAKQLLASEGIAIEYARCLIIGLAYKSGTGDTREAPALDLIQILLGQGAKIWATDPYVGERDWPVGVGRLHESDTLSFDLAIVITRHTGVQIQWALNSASYVLDKQGFFD